MSNHSKVKYAIYCRKSSESEDKQVMSLDAQETELWNQAKQKGYEVVNVYHESMSAKAPGRPVFAEMLKTIESGEADGILCWKLDRLSRNPIDGGAISWMLQQNQLKVIKTHDREYLPSDNVLLMSVEFGMSNQYVRDLSENVKRGNREKLRRGEWPNHAPYGYRNDKSTRLLVVHKEEARRVKQMFEMYASRHYGLRSIAKEIGIRTSSVDRILKRTFYYGLMERGGEFFPGKHEAIISKQLFEEVRTVREESSRPRSKSLFFPYRGLMKCAECGCQLTSTRKKEIYDYYYCTNGKGGCAQHKKYLNETNVFIMFAQAFESLKLDEEIIKIMYQAACERRQNSSLDTQKILADIDLEIAQITRQERKLYDSYESDLISEELYTEKAEKLKGERRASQMKRVNYTENTKASVSTLEPTKQFFLDTNKAIFDFYHSDPEQKRTLVEKLLWNLEVKDKEVTNYKYRSPYHALANLPEKPDLVTLLADRDSNPDSWHQKPESYH